ncbi:MAG: DNA-processing protein DprA, partial [Ignavibacteria bacterium]|nr:DNA-processing protein DprA [Ignavibacteria bacterium]
MNDPIYRIALTLIPNIGDVLIRNLISYCGSEEKIFKAGKEKLLKIPGVGEVIAQSIKSFDDFKRAEEELKFVEKHNIQMLFFTDANYPARLKQYNDSPVLLYYKGTTDLNFKTGVAIVGTRNATDYGKSVTEKLVQELAPYKPVIISGLAYGIDIHAHRDALNNKLETIAVLGHGLHTIYPAQHRSAAQKIVEQGGLLTEFMSSSSFDKENFPKRNRIVAALCDCLVIVESGIKGGALITAHLAG